MTKQGRCNKRIRDRYATWKLSKGCACGCDVFDARELHAHHPLGRSTCGHKFGGTALLWQSNPVKFDRTVVILCGDCHAEIHETMRSEAGI